MLVEHVFAQTTANTLQVGDVIFQLLDCFNLLVKEIRLDEILELNKKIGTVTSKVNRRQFKQK